MAKKTRSYFNAYGPSSSSKRGLEGISTLKGRDIYKGAFGRNTPFIHNSYRFKNDKWAAGERLYVNPLKRAEGGLKEVGRMVDGGELVLAQQLQKHFSLMSVTIDKNLWLFIHVAGARYKEMFIQAFSNKHLNGHSRWPKLTDKTKRNRELNNISQGVNKGALLATGNLRKSIKLDVESGIASASIYTDKSVFENFAYPEWGDETYDKSRYKGKDRIAYNSTYKRWGRVGRVYASIHNEGATGTGKNKMVTIPKRQFIGIPDTDKVMRQLADDYLFFAVFNTHFGRRLSPGNN